MKFKPLYFIIIGLFIINLINAGSPFTNGGQIGITVAGIDLEAIKLNTSREAVASVYNITNGLPLFSGVACNFSVFDTQNNGSLLFTNSTPRIDQNTFYFMIPSTVYTKNGYYSRIIQCISGNSGGFYTSTFYANILGEVLQVKDILFYSLFVALILISIFGLTVALSKLPTQNPRGEDGRIISIAWLKYLRPICYGLIYILIWAIMFYFGALGMYHLPENSLATLIFNLSFVVAYLAIPLILIYLFYLIQEVFYDREIQKLMERGLDLDEK